MKASSLVCLFVFFVLVAPIFGETFIPMFSGPWWDPHTWWGDGTPQGFPGPEDDVIIPPFVAVTVTGSMSVCHNLTVMDHPTNYGILRGAWNSDVSCIITGDLTCNGMIIYGGSGTIHLEVWGNLSIGNGGYLFPNTMHLKGSSLSVTDYVAFSQHPNSFFYSHITVNQPFPGLTLLSDFSLFYDGAYGSISGAEIYLNGHTISTTTLTNCFFTANAECTTGTVSNCILNGVESFVNLTTTGVVQMHDNNCVFHADLINNGDLSGPYYIAGRFECNDVYNHGILHPGWNAISLCIFTHGDIVNNHTLTGDVLFSSEVSHTWTEGVGSITNGSISNVSPMLTLLSDISLQPGQNCMAGNCNLNGYTINNAHVYNANIAAGYGAFSNCTLASLTAVGDIYLNGTVQIMDNNVVFGGQLCINGNLSGAPNAACVTTVEGLFYNYGSITNGWNGTLDIHTYGGFSNSGSISINRLCFEGTEDNADLVWNADAEFDCDITNNTPRLWLLSPVPLDGNWRTWNLNTCGVFSALTLKNVTIPNSSLEGSQDLTMDYVTLNNTQCYMPVVSSGYGIVVLGTENVFHGDLTIQAPFSGSSYTNDEMACNSDLIVSSGLLSNGYSGQLSILLCGDLYMNGGNVSVYNLTCAGLATHEFHQTNPESSLEATIDSALGESILLVSDLQVASGTIFRLYGGSLNLNQHTLDNATLLNGVVQNGTVSYCTVIGITLNDVNSTNVLYLSGNNNVSTGLFTNTGLIVGASYADAEFTVSGDIINSGNLSAGYGGSFTAICYGSIDNSGYWAVNTKIRGILPRTICLNTPGYSIVIDQNSNPCLSGSNLLSSFSVETGSELCVSPGAEMQMAAVDDFYSANTNGYGSFVNHGSYRNTQSVLNLTWLSFYGLEIYAAGDLANNYNSMQTTHNYNVTVPELDDVIPEIWSVLPMGSSSSYNGQMVFSHSMDLLQRGYEGCFELYYRPLGQSNWIAYTGDISFGSDGFSFTAMDIPVGGDYVFVANNLGAPTGLQLSLSDTAFGTRPRLQWNPVDSATYYQILTSDTPYGEWKLASRTTETYWMELLDLPRRFYKVVAHQGIMP